MDNLLWGTKRNILSQYTFNISAYLSINGDYSAHFVRAFFSI
jgi:hypothetical protein